MATKFAYKRLTKEYINIVKNPPPFIIAKPLESNILEWHYVITGPPDSPYYNGEYHGRLDFPPEYPLKPPAIKMITPNGRFKTNFRLCLSMSDYHPKTWNPAWSVSTIITGLLSFMLEDTVTTGSINTTTSEKKRLAKESIAFNRNDPKFRSIFPELCEKDDDDNIENPNIKANSFNTKSQSSLNLKREGMNENNGVVPMDSNLIMYIIIGLLVILMAILYELFI